MIKIHSNIIIGSPNDLTQLLNSVHYVVNCSISLNNLYVHPNYINLNIVNFSNDSLQILNSIFDFINWKILSNQNIFFFFFCTHTHGMFLQTFVIFHFFTSLPFIHSPKSNQTKNNEKK